MAWITQIRKFEAIEKITVTNTKNSYQQIISIFHQSKIAI